MREELSARFILADKSAEDPDLLKQGLLHL